MTKNECDVDHDVMIVGGGPAGISTWLHLNKNSPDVASRTLLIEKERYPRYKLCGGAVGGWSNIVLKQLDVKNNAPYVRIDNIECKYDTDTTCLKKPGFFKVYKREEFDHELAKVAIKRGLTLNEGEKFLDFARKDDHLSIKTNVRTYKVKTLIGADGALSKVRKKMNLKNKPNLAPALEIFTKVDKDYDLEFDKKKVVFDFSPVKKGLQGYIWHFPCLQDSKPFMNHGIGDFRIIKKSPKADMKNIFFRDLEKRNIKPNTKKLLGYPIRWFSKGDTVSQKNIILIGDAAGIDPALGGGIHLALSYGELAANVIHNAYHTNDFSFKNYEEDINSHLIGKFINKCTRLASDMYGQKLNPIEAASAIFNG